MLSPQPILKDSRYLTASESETPDLSLLRQQGKISAPEDSFALYLADYLNLEVIQQYAIPAYCRKTLNKFFWKIDIFIPEHSLAIEINGQQHYTDPRQFVSDYWKHQDCNRLGVTMVSFPCFPPYTKAAYEVWTNKMFKLWAQDIKKLIEAFSYN